MKKVANIMIITCMFLVVYYPPIWSINVIYVLSPICLIVLAYKCIKEKTTLKVNKMFVWMLIIFMVVVLQQLLISKLNNVDVIYSISTFIFYIVGILPIALLICNCCHFYDISYEKMIDNIVAMGVIQAMLSIACYINPIFQEWFIDKLIAYGYEASRFSTLATFRWYGVATQLGFTTPMVQAVISLMCVYLGMTKKIKYFIYSAVLLFSVVINARMAVVMYALGLLYVLLYYMYINKKTKAIKKILLFTVFLVFGAVVTLNIMRVVSPQNYTWAVEGLVASISGRDVEEEMYVLSVDFFVNNVNWQMPKGLDFLVGTAYNLDQGVIQYHSDIGYVNDIWKYGLIISLVLYFLYYKMCASLTKTRFGKMLCGVLLLFFVLGNFKGYIISMNTFAPFVFLICLIHMEYNANHKLGDIG